MNDSFFFKKNGFNYRRMVLFLVGIILMNCYNSRVIVSFIVTSGKKLRRTNGII